MAVAPFADLILDVTNLQHRRLRFARSDMRSGARAATQHALGCQVAERAMHGHACSPEFLGQLALGRDPVSLGPCSGLDLVEDELLDSLAERPTCAEICRQLKVAFFPTHDGSPRLPLPAHAMPRLDRRLP